MKIIISGTIDIDPEKLDDAMLAARPLIDGALTQDGCMDYDWCPDPRIPGRIRVFERWETEAALASHFNNRWYKEMLEALFGFAPQGVDILKYRIDLAEPVYDDTGVPRADFFSEQHS